MSFTSCANSFIAGNTAVFASLTNGKNGTWTVNNTGLTSTTFTVNITSGTTKTPASETGTATFDAGSVSIVTFSTALTGATVGGSVVCTGTTNFNGPYKIQAVADSTDIALQDFRAGVPTETAGSCYVPYVVTVKNPIIAGNGQIITQPNAAVILQGQNEVYPQWYGAVRRRYHERLARVSGSAVLECWSQDSRSLPDRRFNQH